MLVKSQNDLTLLYPAGLSISSPLTSWGRFSRPDKEKARQGYYRLNLTRSIPLGTTTASVVASEFIYNWVFIDVAPRYVLTDNGLQLAAKFLDAGCTLLQMRHYLTTAYRFPTNGQTKPFSHTLVQLLHHYVEEH